MKLLFKKNIIYIYILLFAIISYLSIYKASKYIPISSGKLYYKQIIIYIIGLLIIIFLKKIDIKKIYNLSIVLYIFNIILLLGLLFFGKEINNSKAWYYFFGLSIQPSELMKISLIFINAYIINSYFKKNEKIDAKKEFKLITILISILIIPTILTFIEPDTGATISYFIITFSMLYISGLDKKWFLVFLTIIILSITLFLFIYFKEQELFINIFGVNFFYRIDRIINWSNKSGMQLNNSLISIGSSGLLGHNEVPIYFPEASTDFVFSSFSSSFGLLGAIILIILVYKFDNYIITILKKTKKNQDRYVLFGVLSLFIYQQIQNISMTIGLLPITGITLPLVSYGGSSLISSLILIGIIENIKKKLNY